MPELPEVETIKIGLQRLLPSKQIASIDFDWSKSFPNAKEDVAKFMVGATVNNVKRRAKVLLIALSSKYSIVIHLKMTGQLVFMGSERFGAGHPNESLIGDLPDKSTRVTISFVDRSRLYFNDQRKFGWMRLLPTAEVPSIDFFKKVGPEPLSDNFLLKNFIQRLNRRQKSKVKAVLLDQTVIAGVGNIYADEALYAARIHPETKVKDISAVKLKKLYKSLRNILKLSIKKGGSSDKNYVNADGKKGSYLSFAKVFRREGRKCIQCGHQIIKIRVAGRGTHICPNCQKLRKSS